MAKTARQSLGKPATIHDLRRSAPSSERTSATASNRTDGAPSIMCLASIQLPSAASTPPTFGAMTSITAPSSDMAITETEDDEVALVRARAILVQTATFGAAANDYDARSNGNFDEVAVTAASDQNGGVYIFEYRDGEGGRQVPPSIMPSFEAARQEAIRCAIDLLVDLEPGTNPLTGWLVRVRNQNGELLCAIDVQEAEAARQIGQ